MTKAGRIILIVAACLAVAFCVGSYAIDRALLSQVYGRYTPEGPALTLTDADVAQDYPYQDASFELDGFALRGHVYGDAPDARGLVVFRHGIFSQHQDYLALVTALVDRGWKVFAYDAIGCGESDGDSVLGFAQSPRDVHAAVEYARESGIAGELPILLFGHSWGAYGVAASLDYGDDVAGCVALSGFDTPLGVIMESARASMGPFALTQQPFLALIGWLDFGPDGNRSAAQAINGAGIPVLVAHGTGDETIAFDGASIIAQRDAITNPDATYLVKDEPGRNGHNTYFYSPESQAYLAECAEGLAALNERYGGTAPAEEIDAFMAGVDKHRANTADPALMDQIDAFLTSCIETDGKAKAS